MDLNSEKYIIRKLTKNDYENYLVMINNFRETTFTHLQFIQTLKYIENFSEIWVIELEKEIIATGTIIFEKKFIFNNSSLGHIEDICVKQKYRKNGIGKMLVTHLIQRAKEYGCYKITLACNEENTQFYTKCGLEKRGIQMSQLTSMFI